MPQKPSDGFVPDDGFVEDGFEPSGRSVGEAALNFPKEFLQGVGSGVIKTGTGIYTLAGNAQNALARGVYGSAVPEPPPIPETVKKWAEPPPSLAGRAGQAIEQIGEYFIPGSAGMKATKAGALARVGAEAAGAGMVGAAQTGTPQGAVIPALTAGGASMAIPPIAGLVKKGIGALTGVGSEVAETVAKGAPETVSAMRKTTPESQIIQDFRDALQKVKDARGDAYRQALSQLPQNPLDVAKYSAIRSEIMQSLDKFGVKITKDGLDFSRSTLPTGADRKAVEEIVNDVMDWGSKQGDMTPLGLDTLKRRIDNYYSDTADVRAFVQGAKNKVRQFLNQEVQGYAKMTSDYEKASDFIKKIQQDIVSKNEGTMSRRIFPALKQNNEYRKMLIEALEQYAPKTLKGEIAGHSMSQALPRGLMGPLAGQSALHILAAIGSGSLTPWAASSLLLSSPRLMGEVLNALGKVPAGAVTPAIAGAAAQSTIPPPPQQ